jgi:hypothetical protein
MAIARSQGDQPANEDPIAARFPSALRFILLSLPNDFFDALNDTTIEVPARFTEIRRAFVSNLRRAETVAAVPYTMAHSAVTEQRFQMILTSERIRQRSGLEPGAPSTPDREARALTIARDRMRNEMAEDLARKPLPWIAERTLSVLEDHLTEPNFFEAMKELMLQTLASIWGAFELLANDITILSLNEDPALAARLVNEAPAKRHFPTKMLSFEALSEHGFNISGSMGDILLGDRGLSSLEVIRDVFSTLAAEEDALHRSLGSEDFWRLWQRRHIVVHRRGLVDRAYLDRTGDEAQSVGAPLTIRSSDVEAAFETVRDAGAALLNWRAASYRAKGDGC